MAKQKAAKPRKGKGPSTDRQILAMLKAILEKLEEINIALPSDVDLTEVADKLDAILRELRDRNAEEG